VTIDNAERRDGRHLRTERMKKKLVLACRDLILEGKVPKATAIAEVAGVSLRIVFSRFSSIENLYAVTLELHPEIAKAFKERFMQYQERPDLGLRLAELYLFQRLPRDLKSTKSS
jgi:AcrR family transcriptional regulator